MSKLNKIGFWLMIISGTIMIVSLLYYNMKKIFVLGYLPLLLGFYMYKYKR